MTYSNTQMNNQTKTEYMNMYKYYSKNGNSYNCRTGYTGRFIDLNDVDFMSQNEISINTCKMVKEQNNLHVYKGAVDYMENKSVVIKILKSITKLFKFF